MKHTQRLLFALVLVVLCAFLIAFRVAHADPTGFGPYHGVVDRIIDGDTVVVDLFVYPQEVMEAHIRVNGINAPEMHSSQLCERAAAQKATNWIRKQIPKGTPVIVDNIREGKYAGRALGTIYKDGVNIGQEEVHKGLAVAYHGGTRTPWCEDKNAGKN